jgi:catechol 2,3-dioxygenase-like lactoylglutathione lyase family enzyme
MQLAIRRLILFVRDVPAEGAFYRDVLGLSEILSPDNPKEWLEFNAGTCNVVLHQGGVETKGRSRPPKLAFYTEDVAKTRAELIAKGAKLGPLQTTENFQFCDGRDPEGNHFQLSSRP